MPIQLVEGPISRLVNLKPRTAPRRIGKRMIYYIFFVIATDDHPPFAASPFFNYFETLERFGSAIDNISGNHHLVSSPAINMLCNGSQSRQIAMYIG
jgi:hypothetical protein